MRMSSSLISSCFVIAATTALASAQPIVVHFDVPTMDRWNYPFNASPGFRTSASTFGAPGDPLFDDLDAEFLVGFDTDSVVTPGQGAGSYVVSSASITFTTIAGDVFEYDPTSDPFESFLDPADPLFVPDADAGRPIELFGVGFRNGFDIDTYLEDSAFQQAPDGLWQGTRNAFPTDFMMGDSRDVSRFVEMRFAPASFAVATNDQLTPGDLVPENTTFTMTLDLTNPDAIAYLQQALDAGKLRLMVTSIHPAPTMGQGAQTFPDYYTKENKFSIPFGFSATLDMTVDMATGNPADLNGDGVVNGADLATLLTQWGTNGPADLNNDGTVNGADLATLLTNWG